MKKIPFHLVTETRNIYKREHVGVEFSFQMIGCMTKQMVCV